MAFIRSISPQSSPHAQCLRPHPPGQASRHRAKGERLDATSVACQRSESFPASASGGPGTLRLPVNSSTEPPGTRRGPPLRQRRPFPQLHRLRRLARTDGGTGGSRAPVDHDLPPGQHRDAAGSGAAALGPEDGAGRRRRRGERDAEPPLPRPLEAPGGVILPPMRRAASISRCRRRAATSTRCSPASPSTRPTFWSSAPTHSWVSKR